jgi:hypothetical protein
MRRAAVLVLLLLAGWAFAQTTIFNQDFNGSWTTLTPPVGWQIKYTGDTGIATWHKEPDQGSNPWPTNGTGYAAIYYDIGQPGVQTDSLISPTIDCSIYRSVALRCSTFFRPDFIQPWTAKLMISIDDGATWSTLFNYADSLGPGLQTFNVSAYADLNSLVKLMWVWQGDLANLHWWALDNVSLTGIVTFVHDISAGPVRRPRENELPDVPFTPKAYFNNVGRNPETGILARCEIQDHIGNLVHNDVQTIDLGIGERRVITFAAPPLGLTADTAYHAYFSVATPDDNPLNDSVARKFNVQNQLLVGYDDGVVAGDSHWTSGNLGWGLMVVADTAPAQILDARFSLHLPVSGDTYFYKVRIVDADGPGNSPGTTLYESGPLVAQEGWNADTLRDLRLYAWHDTFFVFYIQVRDWPDAAELNHDAARSDSVQYWKLSSTGYYPDSLNGDWMIRCSLDLAPAPVTAGVNARTVYVNGPEDELVLRPSGVGFVPQARVENFGGLPIFSLPCVCTVYTRSGTPVYSSSASVSDLQPRQGTTVSFASWVPDFSDSARVVVRTLAVSDVDPSDDAKSKMVFIHQSHPTGYEPLDRYAWIDCDTTGGPSYSWVDTTNAYVLISSNIDIRIRIPLYSNPPDFTFPYRDTAYSQFYVCNNGWMSLGADPGSGSEVRQNMPLPDTFAPRPGLFPYWDDMQAGATAHSKVFYKIITEGSARRLVIIWQDMQFFGGDTTNLVSYEAILEQGTGFIWFQYKHTGGGMASHDYGRTATVGIQSADGYRGLQYLDGDTTTAVGFYPGNKLTDGRAILFYPLRRDVGVTGFVTPSKSYILPDTVTPQVRVKNFGSFINPFYVQLRVNRASDNSVVWRDSLPISSLSIGTETLLTFHTWFATTGTFVLKCSTAMSGDTVTSDDSKSLTLNVQSWLQEPGIPVGYYNKRMKAGSATFADPYVYVLKGANTNELWRFQTQRDSWDSVPSMSLGPRNKKTKDGCAIAANTNYVYAVKGGNTREFYRYDIGLRKWATMDSVPIYPYGLRNGTSMACTPNAVYVLVGSNTTTFMKFDVALDTWRFDAGIEGGLGKMVKRGASLDYDNAGNLYAFKGGNTNEFWQYNIAGQRWSTRESIPLGPKRKKVKSGGASAYLNNRVYLLKGGNWNEFWSYDVATRTWRQKSDIPLGVSLKRVKNGSAMTASNSAVYALKGGNRDEFWSYGPGFDTMFGVGLRKAPSEQTSGSQPIEVFALRGGPNPFVDAALIRLAIPRPTRATLKVYDVSGKLVTTLFDGVLPAGTRELTWNARDRAGRVVAGGIYLLKFESADYRATEKLILER